MTRQNNRLLRLNFPSGGPASLVANRIDAVEGLSRDFHLTVECLSEDPNITLKDVQGKMATVELVREDNSKRYFNGYVFEFRRIRTDGGEVYYDMVLLPWLAYLRLRLRRDNDLFHNMTVKDQTDDIFSDYGVRKSEFRVGGPDPVMKDACQYDDSDYNYVHRRWEEKGWFYWYEHTAGGHTLIISDDSTAAAPMDGPGHIPFNRAAGVEEDDALGEWTPPWIDGLPPIVRWVMTIVDVASTVKDVVKRGDEVKKIVDDLENTVKALKEQGAKITETFKKYKKQLANYKNLSEDDKNSLGCEIMVDVQSSYAVANPCLRARKCMLVPYDKELNQKLAGNGCCPEQTGHHILPDTMFRDAAKAEADQAAWEAKVQKYRTAYKQVKNGMLVRI